MSNLFLHETTKRKRNWTQAIDKLSMVENIDSMPMSSSSNDISFCKIKMEGEAVGLKPTLCNLPKKEK